MSIIVGLFALVGVAVFVLVIVLVVQFVRLGRELRRISDDSKTMIDRLRQGTRYLQLAIPIAIALRGKATDVYKKMKSRARRESK